MFRIMVGLLKLLFLNVKCISPFKTNPTTSRVRCTVHARKMVSTTTNNNNNETNNIN